MELIDAIAVYLYLKDARAAYRDAHPAWREATNVLAKHAEPIANRLECADEQKADGK